MRPFVFTLFVGLISALSGSLPAWESQLLPYNGGAGQYQEATVNFAGRDWRLLDYSYAGYKLGAQPLATGVPCTVFPVTGSGDIRAALQAAISSAQASGGVVRIPAGTFTMSGPVYVTGDNVSIEGAGSNATFINVPSTYTQADARYEGLFTFGKGAGGWNKGWIDRGPELTAITTTVQTGQIWVDVTSTAGIAVNDWIVVRQYFWPAFSASNSGGAWSSYSGWPVPTTSANRSFSFTYLRQVLGISGARLTLDAPIPWTLDPAKNPIRVQKVNPTGGFAMRQNVGVSGLSITFADNTNDSSYSPGRPEGAAVHFEGVRDGWIYDLLVRNFPRFAIQAESSARITVLDTQVVDCQDDGGDGYGYGYHWNESQNVLVKRCYAESVRHAYICQHPLTNMMVLTQNTSREARQGDDSHHSFVHGYLFDEHRSYEGSGARSEYRGSTSSGAYETCGSTVFWNFQGDAGRGGGADGGSLFLNPSADGWGMVIGGPGGAYTVWDGDTDAGDLIPPAAGLQVGPTLNAPGLDTKDRNALYEGIGQAGLTPASLYETQLLRRLGSLPADFASACSAAFSRAPVAPRLYTGPGTLIYDSDHLGWVPALGGGCDPGSTAAGGTHTLQCWADSPAQNHTAGGAESALITVTGADWNILMDFTGPTQARSTYSSISFWAYSSQPNVQLRFYVAQREDGTYNDLNAASTLINIPTAGAWTQVTVPMSAYGSPATPFNKIQIRSYSTNGGATVYLDDILLNGGATPTPTATATPAPPSPTRTPTASPSRTATLTPSPAMTATPSASLSPSLSSTRTASPAASATPSATRTASPTASATRTASPAASPTASATPTPLGAWGAEKQLDAFETPVAYFTSFQPAAAGSSISLSNDSGAGMQTEGAAGLVADINFNATAGFAEILRGYGSQTLDLSLDPYGLSFWVKGSTSTVDVRLMLYEDHDMDGDPFESGDEVWSSPAQAMPLTWTRLVLPYSVFTQVAGSGGNGVLDLDRIYAWRLVVDNPGGAKPVQVVVDDLRQLTTRTPAADNSAVLSGSFIQLWNGGAGCACGAWTQGQWDAELQKLKDLCQDTVYVQYGAWEDNAWYAPEGQSFLNFSNPTLGRIFTAAESLGMKVVVGLWFGESWNTDDKSLAATYSTPLNNSTAVAGEIAALYGASPAFGGWYIPQEVDDLQWPTGSPQLALLRGYLHDVAAAAKAAKAAPVYLAPYFGPNRPADDLQAWWTATLAAAPDIDVLIPQDGVGTTRVDGDVDVPLYFAAIKAACDAQGRSFGATVESFQQTDGWPVNGNAFAAVPAPIAQLKSQLWEAKAAGASTLVQFEYPYMQASRGAAYAQLYSDYQAYQSVAAPCGSSPTPSPTPTLAAGTATPTASPSGTPSASPSPSPTRSASPLGTLTDSPTASITPTASPSATAAAGTATPSPSPGPTALLSGQLIYSGNAGGSYHLYRLDLVTGISTQLTTGAFNDRNPQVSPDGRYAVFYSDRDGDQEIWRIDLLDLSLLQLTVNTASDYDPDWSPDGSKIVFKSNRDDGLGDIFVMNADGSGQTNLTPSFSGTEEWDPTFGIDDSKVYFVSRMSAGDPNSDEIFVVDTGDLSWQRLTNNSVPDWYPSVSALAGKVAFVSKSAPASDDDIFTMNFDGSGRSQVTSGNGDDGDPAWSYNSDRLAYVNSSSGLYDLWLMNADGSGQTVAKALPGSTELGPDWWNPPPATRTPSPTSTVSPMVTATSTPTPALPSPTASGTPTRTPSASPVATATPSRSASPSASVTPSATPTLAISSPTATPSATPALSPSETPLPPTLEILEAVPLPNPNPAELRVKMAGPAERLRLRLYSPAMVLLAEAESGALPRGWSVIPLPSGLPQGLVYAVVQAEDAKRKSPSIAPLRLYFIR